MAFKIIDLIAGGAIGGTFEMVHIIPICSQTVLVFCYLFRNSVLMLDITLRMYYET